MGWPTPQDYNEAIQNPSLCFQDEELRTGAAELTALGLPRPNSGAFASVYRMYHGNTSHAVRCFLRNISDQEDRYNELTKYICNDSYECTVPFIFIKQGIRIHADWFPILKMDWVDGVTLDAFVRDNLSRGQTLRSLAKSFLQMHHDLNKGGVAHGDLQHGNIMLCRGELRLVDYDGMFIPTLSGKLSNEIGHPNYQHPARDKHAFGAYLDNFSVWVIYTSLIALSVDPSLAQRLGGLDDCLLFRAADFRDPAASNAFQLLEKHPAAEVSLLTKSIRSHLRLALEEVPPATAKPAEPADLEDLPAFITVKHPQCGAPGRYGSGPTASPSGGSCDPNTAPVLTAENDVQLVVDDQPIPAVTRAQLVQQPQFLYATTAPAYPPDRNIGGWNEGMIVDHFLSTSESTKSRMHTLTVLGIIGLLGSIPLAFFGPLGCFVLVAACLALSQAWRWRKSMPPEDAFQLAELIMNTQPISSTFYLGSRINESTGSKVLFAQLIDCGDPKYLNWTTNNMFDIPDPESFLRRHGSCIGTEKQMKVWFSASTNRPVAMFIDQQLEWFV